MPYGLRS
ncbi:hypothetical protein F610DRAFT_06066 [Streptomyces sp. LaPpAH-199]|nr:hypothetical protein F610DRAFT_06066 [Streptomyces sp. LaPpAH-199]